MLTASQTIGLTSTPNAGGTTALVGLSIHSVGSTIILNGNDVKLVFGYHDITILESIRRERMFRKISPDRAAGATHDSVCDTVIDVDKRVGGDSADDNGVDDGDDDNDVTNDEEDIEEDNEEDKKEISEVV